QTVRHRRLGLADALRQLAQREPELVQEQSVGPRLLDRRELLAGDVLDQAQQERVAVVGFAEESRNGGDASVARGPPAALAGDQLVATGLPRTNDDGLHEALRADRLGQRAGRFAV